MGEEPAHALKAFQTRVVAILTQLLQQGNPIAVGKQERRASRMFASHGTNREYARGVPFPRAVKHAAYFDAAARDFLKPLGDFVPDFFDDHERVLNTSRAVGNF